MMDSNELLENTKKISKCMRMNAEHCFDGCSVCDFYCTKEERDETFKAVIAMLEEGKDTNVPANSALDHIHNVVAENAFNKGYDEGNKEGYERGRKDVTTSLAKQITSKFDEVLGVDDVLEELNNLEAATKGELP